MNLHGLVRGVVGAVNPDTVVQWQASTGQTVATGGKQTATFAAAVPKKANIQPVSTGDIKKYEFLQSQGIYRAVYLFGVVGAIDRLRRFGGDLLQFPATKGDASRTWLVKAVDEQWPDWCRVIVVGELDPYNP